MPTGLLTCFVPTGLLVGFGGLCLAFSFCLDFEAGFRLGFGGCFLALRVDFEAGFRLGFGDFLVGFRFFEAEEARGIFGSV